MIFEVRPVRLFEYDRWRSRVKWWWKVSSNKLRLSHHCPSAPSLNVYLTNSKIILKLLQQTVLSPGQTKRGWFINDGYLVSNLLFCQSFLSLSSPPPSSPNLPRFLCTYIFCFRFIYLLILFYFHVVGIGQRYDGSRLGTHEEESHSLAYRSGEPLKGWRLKWKG